MLPALFKTQEEIIKKLRSVARVHSFENAQTICHIFYDVFKIAYYALGRKKKGLQDQDKIPVILKRREITSLVKLIDYHHVNDKTYVPDHELTQCFGPNFSEDDALKFFEAHIEGNTKDKFGRPIHIDLEDGAKFMYKNYDTKIHEMKPEYYLPHRGKRLPWIRHTLRNSTDIYTRIDKEQREIMYVCKYNLPDYDNEHNKCYWIVIVKKNRKDKIAPYEFKTAFAVIKYNSLLKRLERYQPIIEIPGV
ncbi:MAG: hypothetical protein COS29_03645 [Candidatus Omnitrophica bacterium CG02_land_8_20_14_3_00__42_8]|nr:MAG: hypothetical protein COS29_03645 [Candidatus Omnitrophica bacterium CG02_land_8_20_14_3_00__42_8]